MNPEWTQRVNRDQKYNLTCQEVRSVFLLSFFPISNNDVRTSSSWYICSKYNMFTLLYMKSKYWRTGGSWFCRCLFIWKSMICFFAWQVHVYVVSSLYYAYFYNMNFWTFSTRMSRNLHMNHVKWYLKIKLIQSKYVSVVEIFLENCMDLSNIEL